MSDAPTTISAKTHAAQTLSGGRHYAGRGLGPEPPWNCPNCGNEQHTPIADGCRPCLDEAARQLEKAAAGVTGDVKQLAKEYPMTVATGAPRRAMPAFQPFLTRATQLPPTDLLEQIDAIVRKALSDQASAGIPSSGSGLNSEPLSCTGYPDPDALRGASDLYAEYIGIQLILAQLHAGNEDPLLPSLDALTQRIQQLEGLETLQEYLTTDPATHVADTIAPPDSPTQE